MAGGSSALPWAPIEALDAVCSDGPLVLVLEDLHWSDSATIDLLGMIARRRDAARLLIVGTYRPSDVAAGDHPLHAVKQELEVHGHCEEVALGFLSESAVGDYVGARLPGEAVPTLLASVLHRNTSGNPLFLATVIDDLIARGHVQQVDGSWKAGGPGYDAYKKKLIGYYHAQFDGLRRRYRELLGDPGELERILRDGAQRARAIAAPVVDRVRKAVGL